jgi:hypothetical protein
MLRLVDAPVEYDQGDEVARISASLSGSDQHKAQKQAKDNKRAFAGRSNSCLV